MRGSAAIASVLRRRLARLIGGAFAARRFFVRTGCSGRMAGMDEKPKRRCRIRLRFSLASLLLFTAAIGALFATIMRLQLFRHANQAAVVAKILTSYGNGPYDEVRVNTKVAPYVGFAGGRFTWDRLKFQSPSGWRKTIADAVGLDYTLDVTSMVVDGNQGDPRQLLELAKELPQLKHLTFQFGDVDSHIDLLEEFSQVQTIELYFCNVSPTAVANLQNALPGVNVKLDYSPRLVFP